MPASGASVRLGLRVLKARYLQKKGYLREQCNKLQTLPEIISRKEQELDDKHEERSSSFSSGLPLIPPSDSDGETGGSCGKDENPKATSSAPPAAKTSKSAGPSSFPPPRRVVNRRSQSHLLLRRAYSR